MVHKKRRHKKRPQNRNSTRVYQKQTAKIHREKYKSPKPTHKGNIPIQHRKTNWTNKKHQKPARLNDIKNDKHSTQRPV